MDVSKLPLNKKRTIIAQKFIIAVAERINENEVIISYINLKDHEEVLRFHEFTSTGSHLLTYVDPDYWKIYSDGDYMRDFDVTMFKNRKVKIEVTTYDRSLEITGLKNGDPQQRNTELGKDKDSKNRIADEVK